MSGVSLAVVVGTTVVLSNEHTSSAGVLRDQYKLLWVSRVHRDGSFSCHTISVVVAIFQHRIQETADIV